jgi:threonine dehydratase
VSDGPEVEPGTEPVPEPVPEPGEPLVSLQEIEDAAERIRDAVLRTPLLPGELPDGERVWLKCESLQHGGAFKIRGAHNFIALLPEAVRRRGVVTYSSGNHAQGVARAARSFGVDALIVMPEDAPAVKVEGTRRLGGEVVFSGHTTTERRERAREVARERGCTVVPPYDHRRIIAGQGTAALEAWAQLRDAAEAGRAASPEPGLVLVPIGGGGLISGHAAALAELVPGCRVVGVEPECAASMRRSLEAGEPVSLERVDTIADGLKPVEPGALTFRHVRELVDEVVTVSDRALVRGLRWCFDRRLVVEPSGAATVAALLDGAAAVPAAGETVAVLSGGNVDPEDYARWTTDDDSEPGTGRADDL